MEEFLVFLFSDPIMFIIIFIVSFGLGSSIVYCLMKNHDEYVKSLKIENKFLREQKNKWADRAMEWKEMLDKMAEENDG